MFTPPSCPNPLCAMHTAPAPRFFQKAGFFRRHASPDPVQRFVCKTCRVGFSSQTFRVDYRDRKPNLNEPLVKLMISGVGLRQSARLLGMTLNNVEKKFRKLARHMGLLHERLMGAFAPDSIFLLDELETFEADRLWKPLTVAYLIDKKTSFSVTTTVGTLPPRGEAREIIRRNGLPEGVARRKSESSRVVRETFEKLAAHLAPDARVTLVCDLKRTYPRLAKRALGDRLLAVDAYSSKLPRDTTNPLFRINHALAMARDLTSRLRRRSWLASKKREFLALHLGAILCYRNYIRCRINDAPESAAMAAGFVDRRLTFAEAVAWRQDLGDFSVLPVQRSA